MTALKQPKALPVLFFAELWERFGFYAVQALLVLYLTQKLGWGDKASYALFGAFSALIYATPVIGGFLADRILGYRQAIFMGTFLYIIGYFALGSGNPHLFDLALAALICGNGFFKPNVSSLLGAVYSENDPRREAGFTWFYMGINIGSFLSPIICTYIAVNINWHGGFLAAGIGMLVCLATCTFGFKTLKDKGLPPIKISFLSKGLLYAAILISVYLISLLLHHSRLVSDVLIGIGGIAFAALLGAALFEDKKQRNRLIALIILMIFSIIFWALFVQIFASLVLFIQRNVDRHFFGFVIPAGMFVSIEPFFIILFSPVLATLWLKLTQSHTRFNPSTAMKFAIALVLVGFAFLSMVFGIHLGSSTGMMAAGWLVLNYFLLTMGELSLSPIGLSAVTSLSPKKWVGMVMGLWFLTLSISFAIGGKLADLTAVPKSVTDPLTTAHIYQTHFMQFGVVSIVIGLLLAAVSPYLKKMME